MKTERPTYQSYHPGEGINPLPNPFLAGELVARQVDYANLELHVPEEPVVNLQPRLSLRERFMRRWSRT